MEPPKGYVPYSTALMMEAGLHDQTMLYWRKEWDAPAALRASDFSPQTNVADLYVRDCAALREATMRAQYSMNMLNSAYQFGENARSSHSQLTGYQPTTSVFGRSFWR